MDSCMVTVSSLENFRKLKIECTNTHLCQLQSGKEEEKKTKDFSLHLFTMEVLLKAL